MKNGQKEPFQPVQESALGTKIKDVFGNERRASGLWDTGCQSVLAVPGQQICPSPWALTGNQQHHWPAGHTSPPLPRRVSPLSEVAAGFSPLEIHHKEKLFY